MVLNIQRNHEAYYGQGEGGMEMGEEGDYVGWKSCLNSAK